jgi:hypothetical protein
VARPGERLFEFLRASDRAPMSCELRFNGESYGWEAQFFERGELPYSRGGFVTRALAVQWAEKERTTMDVVSAVRAGAAARHAAASTCPRCENLFWICEQHPDRPWPHDDCHGPGDPCPRCNGGDPPRMPPDFVSLMDGKL